MKAIREFLRPELRKFLLPLFLIALFFHAVGYFNELGQIGDRYSCEYIKTAADLNEAYISKDATAFNDTLQKLWRIGDESAYETKDVVYRNMETRIPLLNAIRKINPLLQESCEANQIIPSEGHCVHYTKKETFECISSQIARIKETSGGLYADGVLRTPARCLFLDCATSETLHPLDEIEYREPSKLMETAGILLLSSEGYLLSCLMVLFLRQNKKRKEK